LPAGTIYKETEILREVAAGNEQAFTQLFNQHWDHIYSVAYSITRSVQHSEDIVQEIFIKVWTGRENLTSVQQFDNYLFILARNHIYNVLKKLAREDRFIEKLLQFSLAQKGNLSPDEQVIFKESQQLMHDAVEQLPSQQKAVYQLSREGGLKYEEIAEKLNLSKSTVRNHMIRALRAIREYVALHGDRTLLIICMLGTLRVPQ